MMSGRCRRLDEVGEMRGGGVEEARTATTRGELGGEQRRTRRRAEANSAASRGGLGDEICGIRRTRVFSVGFSAIRAWVDMG
ncbi:hypothetical protein Dimus_007852 [Dionaea muscipula]